MGINWKMFVILSTLSILFAASISLMIFYSHTTATDQMEDDILTLRAKMECANNECDRFKGADAKALEARLMAEIDKVKKDCKN